MQADRPPRRPATGVALGAVMFILAACSDPGRIEPSPPPVVNVADFGAVGDGATDDRPSIQAALDHARRVGATVYFPSGTFRLATASLPTDRILVTYAHQDLVGAGSEVSRLLVGESFGPYVTVIGAASDSVGVDSWSMANLAIDQNTRSSNRLDVPHMKRFPRMAIRLGDHGENSRIAVSRSAFSDSDSVNTLYLFAASVRILNNRFTQIGGPPARRPHDHSTIYTTATGNESVQQISYNTLTGVRSSGGARTAIETHGGSQLVTSNVVNDYLRGFNVTGIARVPTAKVALSNNRVNGAAIGIQLWSQSTSTLPHQGLANVNLTDNELLLDGKIWSIPGVVAPTAGILFAPTNTAPVNGLTIERNRIVFRSTNTAFRLKPFTAGVSCQVKSAKARPVKVAIIDNVILRAPQAVDGDCVDNGALLRNNQTSE